MNQSDDPLTSRQSSDDASARPLPSTWQLSAVFGLLYFVQGISEPTNGLIRQPAQALLESWQCTTGQVGLFFGLLGFPWTIKPLFGWISDFLPLAGYRRKSYLLLMTGAASTGFLVLATQAWGTESRFLLLLCMLTFPAFGVAFYDVVVDGLMVETAQPLGLTGRLQSVQWTALYASQIGTGYIAGVLTSKKQYGLALAICGGAMLLAFTIVLLFVRERPIRAARQSEHFRGAMREFFQAARSPLVLCVGGFLLLWNFNPFSLTIQQMHVTEVLDLGHEFYGLMDSFSGAAAAAGCLSYAFYCRRVGMMRLVQISIAMGIISTLAYWFMRDKPSAIAVGMAAGFTTATATMIQLDLAARIVPVAVAGTVFALLMSLSNLGSGTLSPPVGGALYGYLEPYYGQFGAYNVLVAIGATLTACCVFIMPGLARLIEQASKLKPCTPGSPLSPPDAG